MTTRSKRFELYDTLGEGAAGVVYDAYDRARGMRVALKTLRRVDPSSLYRFKREFRALRELSHPNIVTPYELIADGDDWLLAMEPVVGQDFLSFVRAGRTPPIATPAAGRTPPIATPAAGTRPTARPRGLDDPTTMTLTCDIRPDGVAPGAADPNGARPTLPRERPHVDEIVDLSRLRYALEQLARALHALHQAGMVHCDVKPANVVVTPDEQVVLIDFGIVATASRPVSIDPDDEVMGTPAFIAPERIGGSEPTAATDWYGFGVMMYVALTGHRPYEGTHWQVLDAKRRTNARPLRYFVDGVPPALEQLCMRLLAREPLRRPTFANVLSSLGVSDSGVHAAARASEHHEDPFVGRVRELAALRALYADAGRGRARCAIIEGPVGIGKSRLLTRFAGELVGDQAPEAVLRGRCHDRENLPYKALDGVADDLAHLLATMSPARRASVVPPGFGATSQLFPTLRQVTGDDASRAYQGRNPIELRAQAFAALRQVLVKLARDRPLILAIEDVQRADRDSLALLRALLTDTANARLLVVLTMRTPDPGALAATELLTALDSDSTAPAQHRIALAALPDDEQRELVQTLADREQAAQIESALWRQAAGHPMLLAELVRYARRAPDALRQAGDISLEGVIGERVAALPEAERALLELLAIAGAPVSVPVLTAASGLSDVARERALSALYLGRFARPTSRADGQALIAPYHDKVREAVYTQLPAPRATALHGRLAEALTAATGAAPATVAEHWIAAGAVDRAIPCLIDAACAAADQLATERAAELYQLALDRMPDGPEHDRYRCQAWLGLAARLRLTENNDEALALLDRAEPIAAAHDYARELAELHFLRGNLLFSTGDWRACLREHERSYGFARAIPSFEHQVQALGGMGDAYCAGGRMRSGYEQLSMCVALCREHGFPGVAIANSPQLAWCRFYQLQLRDAVRDCRSSIQGAQRVGHWRAEYVARVWRGMIATEMRRFPDAVSDLEAARDIARRAHTPRLERAAQGFLARALGLAGDVALATAILADCAARADIGDDVLGGPTRRGALALVTDDDGARVAAIREGEALLTGAMGHNYYFFCRDAIDAAARVRDPDAVDRYAALLERFTAVEPTPWSRHFVARGRAIARHLRAPDEDTAAALCRLRAEAAARELHVAAGFLGQLLDDEPNT